MLKCLKESLIHNYFYDMHQLLAYILIVLPKQLIMNKNRNKQMVNTSNPQETRLPSNSPEDPRGQQQNQPNEGGPHKVAESSTNPARFDDNYAVAEEDAISQDNMKSEDEND